MLERIEREATTTSDNSNTKDECVGVDSTPKFVCNYSSAQVIAHCFFAHPVDITCIKLKSSVQFEKCILHISLLDLEQVKLFSNI